MKSKWIIAMILAFVCSPLTSIKIFAQISVKRSKDMEIKRLKALVEKTPLQLKAHEAFISAFAINDLRLKKQYDFWIKKFPGNAIIPFALGKTYYQYEDTLCLSYLTKAVKIDTNMAEAWKYLSYYSSFHGDDSLAIRYMERAKKADPKNSSYAYGYAYLFREGSPAKYDSLMLTVVNRFPGSEEAIKALYYLGLLKYNANERTSYYESIYQLGAKQQIPWFRAAMIKYYNYLLNQDPEKAFDLAFRMVLIVKFNKDTWKQRLIDARSFWEARKALDEGRANDATEILAHVDLEVYWKLGQDIDPQAAETLEIYKAEAYYKLGNLKIAFDSIASCYSKKPTVRLRAVLFDYGSKLNFGANTIDSSVAAIRNKFAWKAKDFVLKNYADTTKICLADYRGKVVLVTYWMPDCAPCRTEFPHIENVLKKINRKDMVYIAINQTNRDPNQVMPIVIGEKYTFIPLKDADPNEPRDKMYPTRGIPANFLLDKQGRVVFSDFYVNDSNEDDFELMINEMLKYTPKEP